MSDSRVAGGLERLPWLSDDPVRRAAPAKGRRGDLAAWAGSAVLVVAGVSFWLGSHVPISETASAPINQPSATVTIPQPRSAPAPEPAAAPAAEAAPPPPPPPPPPPAPRTYTVVSGDTLWAIAERFYGDGNRYPEIAAASGVANPDLIHPGQVLTIP